jgi:hypothetical protein
MKYTKKAVTIEAFLWTGGPDQTEDPIWIIDAIKKGDVIFKKHETSSSELKMHIKTLEGTMTADVGDYIIQGVKGEIYPCKPDIFEMTYNEASNKVTFGMAVEAMKNGNKAVRKGWNGKEMFLVISPGAEQLPSDKFFNKDLSIHAKLLGGFMDVRPSFMLKTAQEDVAYWSPSGSDALAEDWIILD